MLLLLALILVTILTWWPLGSFVLSAKLGRVPEGYRDLLSALTGGLYLSAAALIWSLFAPVDHTFFLVVQACNLIFLFKVGLPSRRFLAVLVTAAVLSSLRCNQPVTYGDTGIYHMQLLLAHAWYGTIPGFANLQIQYGYTTSFLAGLAPLAHIVPIDYLAGLPSALVYTCLFCLLLLPYRSSALVPERYLWWASLLILMCLPGEAIPSANPDLFIHLLLPVLAWSVLRLSLTSSTYTLACLTVMAKLSALPVIALLLPVMWRRKRIISGLILATLSLVILSVDGLFRSGHPLLPLPIPGPELPWSVPKHAILDIASGISEFAYQGSHQTDPHQTTWFAREMPLFVLVLVSLVLVWPLRRARFLMYFSVVGLCMMLYLGPTWRYCLGFAVILPAYAFAQQFGSRLMTLALAALLLKEILFTQFLNQVFGPSNSRIYAEQSFSKGAELFDQRNFSMATRHFFTACSLGHEEACQDLNHSLAELTPAQWTEYFSFVNEFQKPDIPSRFNLLHPPKSGNSAQQNLKLAIAPEVVATALLGEVKQVEIAYCWGSSPPCAKGETYGSFRLLDPSSGLAGGVGPVSLNQHSAELAYLREYLGNSDYLGALNHLEQHCQQGFEHACYLRLRFMTFIKLASVPGRENTDPERLGDCLELIADQGPAAWKCSELATAARYPGAKAVLEKMSQTLSMEELLFAPSCVRASQAQPCIRY